MIDLHQLPYPRHVHKDGGSKIVQTPDEARMAVDEGWALLPAGAQYDVPGAVYLPDAPPVVETPKVSKPLRVSKAAKVD